MKLDCSRGNLIFFLCDFLCDGNWEEFLLFQIKLFVQKVEKVNEYRMNLQVFIVCFEQQKRH